VRWRFLSIGSHYGYKKGIVVWDFHSISAFNNAGFDLFGNFASLTGYAGDTMLVITFSALLLIGGLGFIVVYELINYPKEHSLSLHSRIVLIVTAILVVGGTFLFWALENNLCCKVNCRGKTCNVIFAVANPNLWFYYGKYGGFIAAHTDPHDVHDVYRRSTGFYCRRYKSYYAGNPVFRRDQQYAREK
jgi:hypothetical protein